MSKLEKKRAKLQERIQYLQNELRMALTKKTSDVKEIDVAGNERKIRDLQKVLVNLK